MERVILHSDLNNCYASIELLHHPELRGKPLVVGGDVEQRHGIVLAKDYLARKHDIKTGEALWQARQKCANLVVVPPNFPLYLRYSQMARKIYSDYTDLTEPFGIDESWLDVTGSTHMFGDGPKIAEAIRRRIKFELGVTVSIGVSYNKIFAKLGSDMKKPDAVTVITKDNYREKVWPLPVGDLLYVGPSTRRKLYNYGITTIGQLAQAPPNLIHSRLGKWGDVLRRFANGEDSTPVAPQDAEPCIKSIGNSATTPRDLETPEDVKIMIYVLAESVAMRMREQGFKARTVVISVRDNELASFERQAKLEKPTHLTAEIARKALAIFERSYRWNKPIRSIGVRATDFIHDSEPVQLDLFSDEKQRERRERLDSAVDVLRRRFGPRAVSRAVLLQDRQLSRINPKEDHVIHPYSYF